MNPIDERTLSFYTDTKWKKDAVKNKEDNEKKKLVMTHGKKKVGKDWKKFRDEQKAKDTRHTKKSPKGVRAVSKGKWGYIKGGKFKSD